MFRVQVTSRRRRLTLALLNFVCVLATLEVCCRLFREEKIELIERDAITGRHLVANFDRQLFNGESGRLVRIRTNSLGFRGAEPVVPKPAGVRRVAVLGDSFIEGFQVDEPETLCGRLAAELNRRDAGGTTWEVLNLGIAGSATADQHLRYLHVLRALDPDVVVVGFGLATDVTDLHPTLSRAPIFRYDFDGAGGLTLRKGSELSAETARLLDDHAHLYRWQRERINVAIKTFKTKLNVFDIRNRIFLDPVPEEIEYSWRLFDAILDRFRDDVEADGKRFVLLAIPSGLELYRDRFEAIREIGIAAGYDCRYDAELPERRVREICRGRGVEHVLLHDAFSAACPRGSSQVKSELLYFKGTGHLNPAGNALAARVLADALLQPPHDSTSPADAPARLAADPERTVR